MTAFQSSKNDETNVYHFALDYLKDQFKEGSSSVYFGDIVEQIAFMGHYNGNKEVFNKQLKYNDFLK